MTAGWKDGSVTYQREWQSNTCGIQNGIADSHRVIHLGRANNERETVFVVVLRLPIGRYVRATVQGIGKEISQSPERDESDQNARHNVPETAMFDREHLTEEEEDAELRGTEREDHEDQKEVLVPQEVLHEGLQEYC